jgi:4-amino-4-deoxy-L-arabinose transferase-like glycosyltransferase
VRLDPPRNKDVLAGLIFFAIGAAAIAVARGYTLGSAMRMGPGYFPTLVGGVLCLFGLYLALRGARSREAIRGEWGWRPLGWITFAIVLFGFTVTRLGLVPALLLMFVAAARAGSEFRLREVLGLSLAMTAFAVAVFVYGLKLPFRLVAGW